MKKIKTILENYNNNGRCVELGDKNTANSSVFLFKVYKDKLIKNIK